MVAIGKPWRAVFVEIPPHRVRAVSQKLRHGVYGVALGLTHFLPVLVEDMAKHNYVFVGGNVKEQGGNGNEGIEPTAGLINRLGNKIGGETVLKNFLILKGIMPLSKGHSPGVEPAVNDLRHAMHFLAALFAGESHLVHIGAVQFDVFRAIFGQAAQFFD